MSKLTGMIGLEGYKIRCVIGVYDRERAQEQEIFIDLKVRCDWTNCVETDLIQDTINYEELAKLCAVVAQEGQFRLLECYAHEVLFKLFETFPISWGWIQIRKPEAIPHLNHSIVELSLSKESTSCNGHWSQEAPNELVPKFAAP